MRFVVSTGSNSGLSPAVIANAAKEAGFDAVELVVGDSSSMEALSAAGWGSGIIKLAAVNFGGRVNALPKQLEFAAQLKADGIRIQIGTLLDRNGIVQTKLIERIRAAGDVAADFGISIFLENDRLAGAAVRLWHLLDRLNHPSILCSWNVRNSVSAGDRPSVGVPMLNLRIGYVELDLADESLPARATLDRLRGIGFDGDVQVNSSNTVHADSAQVAEVFLRAKKTLQSWQLMLATNPQE